MSSLNPNLAVRAIVATPRLVTLSSLPAFSKATDAEQLLALFLSRASKLTASAYRCDLETFAAWMKRKTMAEAVAVLIAADQGQVNRLAMAFMVQQQRGGKSPQTINRRLACLKSLCKMGRLVGIIATSIEVPRVRAETYRDTSGPPLEHVRAIIADLERRTGPGEYQGSRYDFRVMVEKELQRIGPAAFERAARCSDTRLYIAQSMPVGIHCARRLAVYFKTDLEAHKVMVTLAVEQDTKAIRDLGLVRLLFNQGLRCHEIVGADLMHFDRPRNRLSILGKQRSCREWIGLSDKTVAALERWLTIRGQDGGPLFPTMRRGPGGQTSLPKPFRRMDRNDIHRMLKRRYGLRPHGLRHAAITQALEASNGNLAMVQRFSRHKNPQTLMIYDDARKQTSREIGNLLDQTA